MEAIDNKKWGISLANVITIIFCWGSIELSVLTVYFNLKSDVTDVKNSKDSDSKLNELKLRVMDQRIDAMDIQIKELTNKYDNNSRK